MYQKFLKPFIPRVIFEWYHRGRRWAFGLRRHTQQILPWSKEEANPLRQYFLSNPGRLIHKCDHYFDIYHRHFASYRHKPVTILEIGVYHGGSLQMWKQYFGPQARIVGLDINPVCKQFEEPGIEVVIGSQEDRTFLKTLKERYSQFDIIIDDGGHTMQQQLVTFDELYGHVKEGGIFLCEDLATSYWSEYGGGYHRTETFIERSKELIDEINAWHSKEDRLQPTLFTKETTALHFYDSMLVIEKGAHTAPVSHMTGTPSY